MNKGVLLDKKAE